MVQGARRALAPASAPRAPGPVEAFGVVTCVGGRGQGCGGFSWGRGYMCIHIYIHTYKDRYIDR